MRFPDHIIGCLSKRLPVNLDRAVADTMRFCQSGPFQDLVVNYRRAKSGLTRSSQGRRRKSSVGHAHNRGRKLDRLD